MQSRLLLRGLLWVWVTCALTIATSSTVGVFVGPARAAFPGVNGRIVFASAPAGDQSKHEIYTMLPSGEIDERWVSKPTPGTNPKWSRWGSRIAFVRGAEGKREIYVMNTDGTGLRKLTKNAHDDINPTWSPNDESIAFATNRHGNYEIYITTVDRRGKRTRLTKSTARDEDPAWSPNGKRIAFQRNGQICVIDIDGRNERALTSSGENVSPAWSPDGTRIAFAGRATPSGDFEIYSIPATGGAVPTNLTRDPATDLDPAWSPDGKQIAFTSNRRGIHAIHVMGKDGGDDTLLTPLGRASTTSDWKPAEPTTFKELRERVQSGVIKIESAGDYGFGTGFHVGGGLVVTAEHVVAGSGGTVSLLRDPELSAKIVARDACTDVALLLSPEPLSGYRFRLAWRPAREDEGAAAFGYPGRKKLAKIEGLIQGVEKEIPFDRTVQPGFSGGPLVRGPSEENDKAGDVGAVLGVVVKTAKEGEVTWAAPAGVVRKMIARWVSGNPPMRTRC